MEILSTKSDLSSYKMAVIMDDFTYHSYVPECQLLQLTPDNWKEELIDFSPDLLFIESAWRGKDELWKNKIGHISKELIGIVNWCKNNSIPTCFWNKEDPVHFSTFLNVATLFDVIFTTDFDCISLYKKQLKHDDVYLLPFACQPKSNNPIELDTARLDGVCFAGAYYDKYPDRNANFNSMIDHLKGFKKIDIFDRNYGKEMPGYMFPKEYQELIKGTLPFEQIDRAYKGYNYSINLNSVKNSQTMFARRAYELLASNTLVLSNFSKGLRLMFGELVACSDSGELIADKVKQFDGNPLYKDKIRLLGLRKTLEQHTYKDRLRFIIEKLKNITLTKNSISISVIAFTRNDSQTLKVIDMFEQQTYSKKSLTIITNYNCKLTGYGQVKIISRGLSLFGRDKLKLVSEYISNNQWLALFDCNDYYGKNYLTDLALATSYTDAKIIGKGSFYSFEKDNCLLKNSNKEYQYVLSLLPACSIIEQSMLGEYTLKEFLKLSVFPKQQSELTLSIDRFNYCRNGALLPPDKIAEISDLENIDQGVSLDYLNSIDCPGSDTEQTLLSSSALKQAFEHHKTGALRSSASESALIINSILDKGKHKYIDAMSPFPLSDLHIKSGNAYNVFVKGASEGDCRLVISMLDENKNIVKTEILLINQIVAINIPNEVAELSLSIRIRHRGKTSLFSINFDQLANSNFKSEDNSDELTFDLLMNENIIQDDLSIYCDNKEVKLSSALDENQHQYIYSSKFLDVSQIFDTSKNRHSCFVKGIEESKGSNFVIIYFNAEEQRIGHSIISLNRNTLIELPENTSHVKLGFRKKGGGNSIFQSLRTKVKQSYNRNAEAIIDVDSLNVAFSKCKTNNVQLNFDNDRLILQSSLEDHQHEYVVSPIKQDISLLKDNCEQDSDQLDIYLQTTSGLYLNLVVYYFDENNIRIAHDMVPTNKNFKLTIPERAFSFALGFRALNSGECKIEELVFAKRVILPSKVIAKNDTLILTNHYPSYDNLYRNGFVHSRVKSYREENVNVDIFRFWPETNVFYHEYENVDVITGGAEILQHLLRNNAYKHILVHFLDEGMWSVLQDFPEINITVWVHGAEIQPWWRRLYNYSDEASLAVAKVESDIRMAFWQPLFNNLPNNLKFVFVSQYFADEVMEDVGKQLDINTYTIIHNPVDTDLFTYQRKPVSQRLKVLSIRPYASAKYANDLSVKAVELLSKNSWFKEVEFNFIGDGQLFDELLSPLKHFPNVKISKGFLKHKEIANIHKEYGVFLCPTRMDAQGVSKDEAMSSGLVVISNAVTAIPEFIDEQSGMLVAGEDFEAMAECIKQLYLDKAKFSELSENAAIRVRKQTAIDIIVKKELALFHNDSSMYK